MFDFIDRIAHAYPPGVQNLPCKYKIVETSSGTTSNQFLLSSLSYCRAFILFKGKETYMGHIPPLDNILLFMEKNPTNFKRKGDTKAILVGAKKAHLEDMFKYCEDRKIDIINFYPKTNHPELVESDICPDFFKQRVLSDPRATKVYIKNTFGSIILEA